MVRLMCLYVCVSCRYWCVCICGGGGRLMCLYVCVCVEIDVFVFVSE